MATRKKGRRKNPTKKLWVVFAYAITTNEIFFATGMKSGGGTKFRGFSSQKRDAALFQTKKQAAFVASEIRANRKRLVIGVAPDNESATAIRNDVRHTILNPGKA